MDNFLAVNCGTVMKKIKGFSTLIICLLITFSSIAKDVYVKGYYKNNGTYVAPHYRSAPNHTVNDNWTTYGNINPHTGEAGTKRVFDTNTPTTAITSGLRQLNTTPTNINAYSSKHEPIVFHKKKNTLDTFWETLIYIFVASLFFIILSYHSADWVAERVFGRRKCFASLINLKSIAIALLLLPLVFNVALHFYLLASI